MSRLALGVALGAIGVLVVAAVIAVFVVQPSQAINERSFGGSYVLNNDSGGPVVVDLASGSPTIRLVGLQSDVQSASPSGLDVSPLNDGWLLLNSGTGDVNFLDRDNLVLGPSSGLNLPGITAFASRVVTDGSVAFVIRGNGTSSDVVEVSRSNVALAAQLSGSGAPVHVNAASAPPVLSGPGDSAASNGDLWAIAQNSGGSGDELLSFRSLGGKHPALIAKTLGAAGASDALVTNGTTGKVVLASSDGIRTVSLDGEGTTASLAAHGTVESIVPVSGGGATQWFLYREGGTWREVAFDTIAQRIVTDRTVSGLSAPYVLSPVSAGGQVYAMSSNAAPGPNNNERSGLFSLDLESAAAHPIAIDGQSSGAYPEVNAERPVYWNQSVVVAGPRVIFNNPDSELSVMIFLDGSHAAKIIDKFAATSVDPSSVLAGLIQQHPNPQQSNQPPPAPTPAPQQVDQNQSCKSSTESPHVPTIQPLQPGANSVLVQWTYPLLDAEDCQPSSYEVDITPQGGADAPPNDPFFINNAATQFEVTGLESQSQYQVVVTAFINQKSTPSLPAFFTTAAGAPASPSKVTTSADGTGWTVQWTPCGGNHCGNPLAYWNVTSAPCGSSVSVNPPGASGVSGSEDTVHIPFSSSAPPGTSLSFSVAPGGSDGSTGTPTNDGQCTEGWSAPQASQLTLSVLYPNPNSNQVVLSVSPPPSAGTQSIYGSAATQFTYSLTDTTDPSQSQHPPSTASASQTLTIITGDQYTAQVVVTPTVHPSSAVTLGPKPVSYNSPWPSDLGLSATAADGPTYSQSGNTMTATVAVADAFGGNPNNKPLALAASGSVACENTGSAFTGVSVTPAPGPGSDGTFTVMYPQPTNGTTVVNCSITGTTITETDSSNVHTATSPSLSSPAFPSGKAAFAASFDIPQNANVPDGLNLAMTGVTSVSVQLEGGTTPQAAIGVMGCGDKVNVSNNQTFAQTCAKNLQDYANKNGTAVTWSPFLVVSWGGGPGGGYSEGVPVACDGGCPTFNSSAPTVTGVSPNCGQASATVTISGSNFASTATVDFGNTPSSGVTDTSSTSLTAVAPSGPSGTVDVVVTVSGLSSATSTSDQFTYSSSCTSSSLRRPAALGIGVGLARVAFHPILGVRRRHDAAPTHGDGGRSAEAVGP